MTLPDSARVEPEQAVPTTVDELAPLYRQMLAIRRMEEAAAKAYSQGKIGGFLHLYIGQEPIAVGAVAALRPTDYLLTTYRDHGMALARGMSCRAAMAELFGKVTGCSKGLGGSMHFFDIEHHFYGGYGIVGGQIPLAAGLAFASKYRNEDRIAVCSFGDAASNQGAMHETFNMASKWKLPVLYVVENNKYGMGTDIARVSAEPDIHKRAVAWNMRGVSVDGMDVLAVTSPIVAAKAKKTDAELAAMKRALRRADGVVEQADHGRQPGRHRPLRDEEAGVCPAGHQRQLLQHVRSGREPGGLVDRQRAGAAAGAGSAPAEKDRVGGRRRGARDERDERQDRAAEAMHADTSTQRRRPRLLAPRPPEARTSPRRSPPAPARARGRHRSGPAAQLTPRTSCHCAHASSGSRSA